MINLTKGNTESIIVTPLENSATTYSIFYFKFTSRITQDEVECWLTNTSTTERYQQFSLVVNSKFANEVEGFYTYEIYGAINGSTYVNVLLETGYMHLHPTTNFEPTTYNDQINTFKVYNGQ